MATISIDVETREALKELGKMGDTYNDVITDLITMYKYSEK